MKKAKTVYLCVSCDSPLSTERLFCDERCKQIDLCKSMGTTKYKTKHVAPMFQKAMRAEYGAIPSGYSIAVSKGEIIHVWRNVGQVVCITCGRVCPWESGSGESQLHCGHFLAGRGSILFEEDCVNGQCSSCNRHHGGRPLEYKQWMAVVRPDAIERLEALKHQPLSRTRDELVDLRIEYSRRLKAAQAKMKGNQ